MRTLPVRWGLILAASVAVAACGGSSTPTAPPVTIPSIAVPSFAAPSFGVPSFAAPSFALPSIAAPSGLGGSFVIPSAAFPSFNTNADPALAARFPTTIGGQPVMNLVTYSFSDFMNVATDGDPAAEQMYTNAFSTAGIDPSTSSYGEADVTLAEDDVDIAAIHTLGSDSARLVSVFPQIFEFFNPDQSPPTVQQANVGGKTVTEVTDEDGDVTYVYAQPDVVWTIDNADDSEATTVLQALP